MICSPLLPKRVEQTARHGAEIEIRKQGGSASRALLRQPMQFAGVPACPLPREVPKVELTKTERRSKDAIDPKATPQPISHRTIIHQ
jgi:hypothetical protein